MDLDFYVRVRTCKKRVTGKQPLTAQNGYHCMHLIKITQYLNTTAMNAYKLTQFFQ